MSTQKAKLVLNFIIPIFVAVFSFYILSAIIPETKFVKSSIESMESSQKTVMKFAGATVGTSVAISAFPDDFATPLANTISGMNKYFVFILMVIFVEKLVLIEGTKIALVYIIPIACGIYIISLVLKNEKVKNLSYKLAVFALAVLLVIPCSTHFVQSVGADYLEYVDETIAETEKMSDILGANTTSDKGNATLTERITGAFDKVVSGVEELFVQVNNMLKKCMNSIAILIVTNFVLPVAILFVFKFLLQEIFSICLPPINFNAMEKALKGKLYIDDEDDE